MRGFLLAVAAATSVLMFSAFASAQPATPAPVPTSEVDEEGAPEGEALPPAGVEAAPVPAPAAAPPVVPAPPPQHPMAMPWYAGTPGPVSALQPPVAAEAEKDTGPTRDMTRDFWQVYAGIRSTWTTNDAYNVFDENDAFTHSSIGASRAFVIGERLSIAPGILWEFGTLESTARGAQSELFVHRLGGVAEGRLHLGRDLYALAKIIPQAVHTRAYLNDVSSPAVLQQRTWRFGMDATVGAAWNAPRSFGAPNSVPQFWLVGEVGYGWMMSKDLEMSPDVNEDDPQARMKLNLGPLAMNGMMLRINVAMTF